ncbi:MAG: porin family protein [Salinibacter sp.]
MDTDSGGRAAPSTTVLDGRWDTEENELSQRGGAITSAQADAVDLQVGIRVGLNFATFGGEEAETIQTLLRGLPSISGIEEGRRTGLIAGAFVVADFGGPVALRPGIRYIQKGSQIEFTVQNFGGETESGSITIKADYLEVPIQARVELPAVGPVVPHVLAGPTVGFSVNAAAEASLEGESEAINVGEDLGGNAISLEFGAGAGIEVGAGRMVTLDARFGLGLSDVPGLRFSAQNRGIMATVGLTF